MEEEWSHIPEFSSYDVSNLGNIYNRRTGRLMRTSLTNFGNAKIALVDDRGVRRTMGLALLVAEQFVERPHPYCTTVIILDGDPSRVDAANLAWRPPWFAWKYTHQLRTEQHIYFRNLPVIDVVHQRMYDSIVEAGMNQGLLFEDIWESTYTFIEVFPTNSIFKVFA